jgi:signal transduction histidine kinase
MKHEESSATQALTGMGRGLRSPRYFYLGFAAILLMVCGVTAVVAVFAIRDVRSEDAEVERMYAVSVIGLRRIGDLIYQAQETRRSAIFALSTTDSNLQVEYADNSREADHNVTKAIAEYLQQVQSPAEVAVGQHLQSDWLAYLKVRDEVLGLILEGSTKEAVELDLKAGTQSFDRVRADLTDMRQLYDSQALQQLTMAGASGRSSVIRLTTVLFLTFLFAGIALWAVYRSRMQSALDLAKLQMDFVAGVSHELRTPLSVLCLAAQNIADGVIEDRRELVEYGSTIRRQAQQITGLVDQILLFASTRSGKVQYALRPVAVSEVVETVLNNVSELLQENDIVVEQHLEPGLADTKGDFSALCHCLQNLVVNAVKYGGDSHWIGIRTSRDESRRTKEILISVEDRGIGMTVSELRHIFEPFYRSPSVIAAQIHGTGLGLALTRNIVQSMGGRITVQSQPGVGSTFTLHLAAAERSVGTGTS